jgi:ADP-heptose:LPS heptosyltransferase
MLVMANPAFLQNIRLMRRIDQYLGPPLCVALAIPKTFAGLVRRRRVPGPIKKILVIKFWGMGSIVLATPALRAFKDGLPGCEIAFLTFEQNEAICRSIHSIDQVRVFRANGLFHFLSSFIGTILFLRRERFDAVVDLEFFANFTSILAGISGAPASVGFTSRFRGRRYKAWREFFYTERIPFDHRHIGDIFLEAPRALGAAMNRVTADAPRLEVGPAAAPLMEILAAKRVGAADPLACINVNASPLDYKRRWPLESYKELIERILARFEALRLVLVGATEDVPYVAELLDSLPPHPNVINLCGQISVEQLILLLQRTQLFIGNDSGPLHLAASAGVPTVSFFGPETPALYGPRGPLHTVLFKNISCSPCLNVYNSKNNSFCRDNVCMKSISVEEAWTAVRDRLNSVLAASAGKVQAA